MITAESSIEKSNDDLVKVELGCGCTKSEGYIGIDRFQLSGVDIVADLDKGIPLESNSVDMILASNSLEHLENLSHIMSEIYRVCRNRAIIYVLTPYHNTSINQANIYHKQVFNEDTFRFFTDDPECSCVAKDEYYCPHAVLWGLGRSDNSELLVNLQLIHMEFFYYREYRALTECQKRHARKALNNVCDLIYYVLVVNKGDPLSEDELKILNERAKIFEPPILRELRERDTVCEKSESIITDLQTELQTVLAETQSELQSTSAELRDGVQSSLSNLQSTFQDALTTVQSGLETTLNDEINKIAKDIGCQFQKLREEIEQESAFSQQCYKKLRELKEAQIQLRAEMLGTNAQQEIVNRNVELKQMELSKNLIELLQRQPIDMVVKRALHLFDRKSNLFPTLSVSWPKFVESIILDNNQLNHSSVLQMSNIIPFETYVEYPLAGYGERMDIFLLGILGSRCLVEIVSGGTIIKQDMIILQQEGLHSIALPVVKGEIFVRFRCMNSHSVLKVLEVSNRRYGLFRKNSLAAYIA